MGRDKFENEDLIRWGHPEDVWFHADRLSSAHVYLRLPEGVTIDTIPEEILEEMCQLTKDNSIEGRKKASIHVQYTYWENLLKTPDMEVGAVSFVDSRKVFRRLVEKKKNIVNRIAKTKVERDVDLAQERASRDERQRRKQADIKRKKKLEEKEAVQRSLEEKAASKRVGGYDDVFADVDAMPSNKTSKAKKTVEEAEDDFM
eukprot:TRINITY_DN80200_c0_g1_i1.p1 TRINITY_DN80200_c0_g1~~TRINITY_DN80200_c0_g1_i1.p1  ORF type:complete len:221 (-),score=64.38 TRINITY_DN80200_c0_g1_i1:54-659(-)